MAQTRGDAKVGVWFAEGYSCVSMDRAPNAKFRSGPATCPHADTCPGCPLLDLSYPEQLAHKQAHVEHELGAYRELAALRPLAIVGADATLHYRTRAKLVVGAGALGLYARGSHALLDIPHCRAFDPLVAEAVNALRALLPATPLLAGVDVARAGEQLLVTLIAEEGAEEAPLAALADQLAARCPAIAGIACTRREAGAVQLLASGHTLLRGRSELRVAGEPAAPYHYVAFGAFMQAHAQVAQRIYDALAQRALGLSGGRPRVLELYAGSGALALALAACGAQLVAVESYGPACERLTRAAREQSLPVTVLHAEAGEALRRLREKDARFDVVLVNPPRRGLTPEVRGGIAVLAPAALGYVSCRARTLARDLAHFARLGWGAESVQPFDMMPMTDQAETLAWLTPRAPGALVVVATDETRIAVEKPPFETMEQLTTRVRGIAGWQAATPEVELSADASGLVAFTRASASGEQSMAPHTFFVLARGVLRARGKLRAPGGGVVHYQRERVIAGHSLLRAQAGQEVSVRRALAAIAHPVLGDAKRDRVSARHFALRHGLDRCFLHLCELGLPAFAAAPCALAPDLRAVLASLGERRNEASLGERERA
jgi:23S rRNA (uracil1939-C5)-methyltransferase